MRDAAVQTDSTSICNETCIARVVQQLLQSDDAAVKFYTGLPTFSRLKAVFNLASGYLGKGNSSLSSYKHHNTVDCYYTSRSYFICV